jgi:hypothetical protein
MSEKYIPAGAVTATYDSNNPRWIKGYGGNRLFLQAQQHLANMILFDRGYITLNEVFAMLDLPQTEEGALAGWVSDGIRQIDFGEEADAPPPGPKIELRFNINSNNVFQDKK